MTVNTIPRQFVIVIFYSDASCTSQIVTFTNDISSKTFLTAWQDILLLKASVSANIEYTRYESIIMLEDNGNTVDKSYIEQCATKTN